MDQTDQITRQTELVPDVRTSNCFAPNGVSAAYERHAAAVTKKQGDGRLQNLSGWRHIVVLVTFSSRTASHSLSQQAGQTTPRLLDVSLSRRYFRTAIPWVSAVSFPSFIFVMTACPL
jgi:hypothetical protein